MNKIKLLATITFISIMLFVGFKVFKHEKCVLLEKQQMVKRGEILESFFSDCVKAIGSEPECAKEVLNLAMFLYKLDLAVQVEEGCK